MVLLIRLLGNNINNLSIYEFNNWKLNIMIYFQKFKNYKN